MTHFSRLSSMNFVSFNVIVKRLGTLGYRARNGEKALESEVAFAVASEHFALLVLPSLSVLK